MNQSLYFLDYFPQVIEKKLIFQRRGWQLFVKRKVPSNWTIMILDSNRNTKILNWMVASMPRLQSALTSTLNFIFICSSCSQMLKSKHFVRIYWLSPCHYFVLILVILSYSFVGLVNIWTKKKKRLREQELQFSQMTVYNVWNTHTYKAAEIWTISTSWYRHYNGIKEVWLQC